MNDEKFEKEPRKAKVTCYECTFVKLQKRVNFSTDDIYVIKVSRREGLAIKTVAKFHCLQNFQCTGILHYDPDDQSVGVDSYYEETKNRSLYHLNSTPWVAINVRPGHSPFFYSDDVR